MEAVSSSVGGSPGLQAAVDATGGVNFAASDQTGTNLIVNYIPSSFNEERFRALFEPYGEIEHVKLMLDKMTGNSMGYGFIKFKRADSATRAIQELTGRPLEGKVLKVSYARPAGSQSQPANLYVANLPEAMSKEQVEQIFSPYGRVVETKILTDRGSGASKGVSFVRFEQRQEAESAIYALNGTTLPGMTQPMKVKFADTSEDKQHKKTRVMMPGGVALRTPVPTASPYAAYAPGADYYTQLGVYYAQQAAAGLPTAPAPGPPTYNPYLAAAMGMPAVGTKPSIFIYSLPPETDEALVYRLFGSFGGISKVTVVRDPKTNMCKGYGFVDYTRIEDATAAITAMNGALYKGKPLQVSFKKAQ